MKVSNIILASFFCTLLVFLIAAYLNYKYIESMKEKSERVVRHASIVKDGDRFQKNFLIMVNSLKGYLLTGETSFNKIYDSAYLENEGILSTLSTVVPDDSDQKILIDDIHELSKYWVNEFANPLIESKINSFHPDAKKAFHELYKERLSHHLEEDVQGSIKRKFADLTEHGPALSNDREAVLYASIENAERNLFYFTGIYIVAVIGIAFILVYYISSQLAGVVKMTNSIVEGNNEEYLKESNSDFGLLAKTLNNLKRISNTKDLLLSSRRDEMDRFIYVLSHDVNASLKGVSTAVDWINEDATSGFPTKFNEYLQFIKNRINRAENLLVGILSYMQVGREEQKKEVVDVNELLLDMLDYVPTRPGIELHIQSGFPTLFTERKALSLLFMHLIINAFQHHDKDKGNVKVCFKDKDSHYEFFVEDDGPGIDKSDQQRIFAIFQTIEEKSCFKNIGVGLAIVKKILDSKGLKINLISQPGIGSIFSFKWPKT
jgi:signal transduction histidine kinase